MEGKMSAHHRNFTTITRQKMMIFHILTCCLYFLLNLSKADAFICKSFTNSFKSINYNNNKNINFQFINFNVIQQQHSKTIITTATRTSLHNSNSNWIDNIDSQLILAVGDYATEIENSVGSEIYAPIFKAGLFIFISGLVSAFLAAFIVSKADSWDGLEEEFQLG